MGGDPVDASRCLEGRVLKVTAVVVLFGLMTALSKPKANAQTVEEKSATKSGQLTALFLDRRHVDQGRMTATYDRARVPESAYPGIARTKRDWNIIVDLSGHGMKRLKMPVGVRFTVEKPRKTDPWLRADRPWEKNVEAYHTVIHEDGKYRCWYRIVLTEAAREAFFPPGSGIKPVDVVLAYAESDDGMQWTKPGLDVYHFGDEPTNVITHYCWESCVFRDDSAPASERYKCFTFDMLPDIEGKPPFEQRGLYGCVSPDGIHWTRLPDPLLPYFHDTANIAAWDPILKKYVGYFRGHLDGRAISRSETDDFRSWPPAEVFLAGGPQDSPADDYYTNGFTFYPDDPSLCFLFPGIYHHSTDEVDVRMAVSRNNRTWNWMTHDTIIELGAPGEWDSGVIYAAPNMVHLPDGRLALPYAGARKTHNEDHESLYESGWIYHYHLGWATWDDGRLAGLEAAERGEFWSRSLGTFDGTQIAINARTPRNGMVEVALHEPYGRGTKPLPGYNFADCIPFNGDAIWEPLKWKNGADLTTLRGKELILHFRLTDAKVFGIRFIE
jgi:hypothetical protein